MEWNIDISRGEQNIELPSLAGSCWFMKWAHGRKHTKNEEVDICLINTSIIEL